MSKINNSYETDPSTGSSSLSNNDLTTEATTTATTPALEIEWQEGTVLKDFLFSNLNKSEQAVDKGSNRRKRHHHQRNYQQSNETDRSMVNSSQESDFYGFTPASVTSVDNTHVYNDHDDNDDNGDHVGNVKDIGQFKDYNLNRQNELILSNATTTLLEPHRLYKKLSNTASTEYGLEQTIASEEYSDQDIRCLTEMTKNEQQIQARIDNTSIDGGNESHLTIEPNSSDDEEKNENDMAYCKTMHKAQNESKRAIVTTANIDEDSDNAVDNAISNERYTIGNSSTPTELSFNGKLKQLPPINTNELKNVSNNDRNDSAIIANSDSICNKSNLELQLQLETSREHINERSPDLFSEVDDLDNMTTNDEINDDDIAAAAAASANASAFTDNDDDGVNVSGINDSIETKAATTDCPEKHIEMTERALNKRIQTLLSGLLPPPSITFVQHDIINLLSIYKRNIALMDLPRITGGDNDSKSTDLETVPSGIKDKTWPQLKWTRAYGIHYNRTKYTDHIESMYMKLVERNVGQETASSFTFNAANNTSAAAKRKPIRKLTSSPGNRLSHLARRRAIFSSANLQSQKQSQFSVSSKLGQKTCVIDASKLSRKEKVATPKRRALAQRRTPGRKTPSSLKKQQMVTVAPKFGTATRETSKRALFLSPTQEEVHHNVASTASGGSGGDISRRIEKSKRALFSPPRRLERSISNLSNSSSQNSSMSFGSMLNAGSNKMTSVDRLTYFNRTSSDVLINLKRKLERDDDNENMEPSAQRSKFQRTDQSNYSAQTNKLTKAASENSMYPNQQLSASHKQKLLWSVSTALKKKSITSTNSNYSTYAMILAKVVKRLYLESLPTKTDSTSATMLRLADRLVFWVLKGKSVDEIYLEEKIRMGATKNAVKRPSGYINRDDYLMRLEASNKLNTSTQSIGSNDGNMSSTNLHSMSNENLNCSSSDQNRPILTNSSSKSNVGTSALRENHDSKSAQKSASHLVTTSNVSFSGRNQKNLSPYNDKTRSTTNLNKSNKLLAGGINSSILKVKRQISFDN